MSKWSALQRRAGIDPASQRQELIAIGIALEREGGKIIFRRGALEILRQDHAFDAEVSIKCSRLVIAGHGEVIGGSGSIAPLIGASEHVAAGEDCSIALDGDVADQS